MPLSTATPHLPTGQPMVVGNWFLLPNVVELLATAGRHDDAAKLYPDVLEALDLGLVVTYTGLVEMSAGIAAACGAQWDAAERHFDSAWRLATDAPFRVCQPEIQRWRAWMLAWRGRPEDRVRRDLLVTDAMTAYSALGMPRHVALTAQLMVPAL